MNTSRVKTAIPRFGALVAAAALAATTLVLAPSAATAAPPEGSVTIDKNAYADRMAAMWMAECLANWTGLQVEHDRPNGPDKYSTQDPFYTDADWGTEVTNGQGNLITIDWENPDPCGADDDTDIEYSYLHEMVESAGTVKLSAEDIAHAWNTHVDGYVWFSNSAADLLIQSGVRAPSTTLSAANQHRNIIDAQLTTELFGALAPARPDVALDIAQLPIRTSAGGFATHAAQFNVLLYSLATLVDPEATPAEQVRWMIDEARSYLPGDSRIAEIIDWVTAEYDGNPGEPWEALRDRIFDRYQANSVENGFNFIIKYESAVNLAAQVMELLHGEGDLLRTLQIGVLAGWDADNPTASNAGLLGLMLGTEQVEQQFTDAGIPIVERFNAARTRVNMTDYLPDDPEATDTFDLMGARAIPLVDEAVAAAGGTVSADSWTIPLTSAPASADLAAIATLNPDVDTYVTSGNNAVLRAGGSIDVTSNLVGDASLYTTDTSQWPAGRMFPTPVNSDDLQLVANGLDQDTRGQEEWTRNPFFTGTTGGEAPVVEVVYDTAVEAESVRLIGGGVSGGAGWATGASVEVRTEGGEWIAAPVASSTPLNPAQPFQQTDLVFEGVLTFTGVRVAFEGTNGVLSLTEIDPVAPTKLAFAGFDPVSAAEVVVSVDGDAGSSPEQRTELEAGDEVTVRYSVTNTGEVPLTGVTLRDGAGQPIEAAVEAAAVAAEVAPGATWTTDVVTTAPEGEITLTAGVFARGAEAVPVTASDSWYGLGVAAVDPGPGTGPNPTEPGTPPGSPGNGGSGSGGRDSLASTGADLAFPLTLGAALLLLGGLALGARQLRRRRS
ncbi:MAG: hypothetical protein K0S37_3 [Microbacterium sp.]|nr:hypothetical protein [Microbacterium sp.]